MSDPSLSQQLFEFIQQHRSIVVLTGAGISLNSGIPTYRDQKGVWQGDTPMQHNDFIQHAATRRKYWARSFLGRSTIADAQPNQAHSVLALLENAGYIDLLITQNVDNLHQRTGSQNVVDLHGNLRKVICLNCGENSTRDEMQRRLEASNPHLGGLNATVRPDGDAILDDEHVEQVIVPACEHCGGVLMPDVVFFGGTIPRLRVETCLDALRQSGALLVIGSSLKVYSGYRFCLRAQEWDIPIALLNPGLTRADDLAALKLKTTSEAVLTELANKLRLS